MDTRTREKRKIIILGFGGSITMGRDFTTNVLKPMGTVEFELVGRIDWIKQPMLSDPCDERVEFRELTNLDSTNVNPSHWAKLAFEIASIHGEYDGIIVTHGTDTMPYTAGAVALVLGRQLQIPVVFTGAQLPLCMPGTDARFNLDWALEAIHTACDLGICEVMIAFNDRVLRACRAIKVSEANFQAFDSPAFPPLGRITALGVEFIPQAFRRKDNAPAAREKLVVHPHFDRHVLTVEIVPGLAPDMLLNLLQSWECHGLLLKSLGAGNVPCEGEYSLLPVIEAATARRVPVLVSTKFVGGKTRMNWYEPGMLALKAGAIPTGDLTDVMAQVKLMWALGKGFHSREQLLDVINTDVVGEITT